MQSSQRASFRTRGGTSYPTDSSIPSFRRMPRLIPEFGGPLVNMQGEIIGINTAILTDTNAYAGVGFAMPSNTVDRSITADWTESPDGAGSSG